MADENHMSLVRTTLESEDQAKTLARRLIADRFACCVHVHRIESFYRWEGRDTESAEWLLEARCPQETAEDAWVAVKADHPYQVPLAELVPETRVNGAYAQWARAEMGLND